MGMNKMNQKEETDEKQRSEETRQWVKWEGLGLLEEN